MTTRARYLFWRLITSIVLAFILSMAVYAITVILR